MIIHENRQGRRFSRNSIAYFFRKLGKISAAVVIGALMVNNSEVITLLIFEETALINYYLRNQAIL